MHPDAAMLTDLDRIVIAARYRQPVVQALRSILGAEVAGSDRLPLWSAGRTTLRAGVSEIEVLEPQGVGAVADFIGRRGPGLFAVGFASADAEKFRAHLETRGVSFEEHEGQLFVTSDKGTDLPGVNLVVTPEQRREPVGLVQRLCGATLLHRSVEPGDAWIRIFGVSESRLSGVSRAIPGFSGTVIGFGRELTSRLAILAPSSHDSPIGRFVYRNGSGLYLAVALSEELTLIRERLADLGHSAPHGSEDGLLLIPSELLGGACIAVAACAAECSRWDVASPVFDAPHAWT